MFGCRDSPSVYLLNKPILRYSYCDYCLALFLVGCVLYSGKILTFLFSLFILTVSLLFSILQHLSGSLTSGCPLFVFRLVTTVTRAFRNLFPCKLLVPLTIRDFLAVTRNVSRTFTTKARHRGDSLPSVRCVSAAYIYSFGCRIVPFFNYFFFN